MITVNQLREFLIETQTAIPQIDFAQLVIDDSELTRFLKEREEKETMLFAIMPEYPIEGEQDAPRARNLLMFMILEKTAYREDYYPEYLDCFQRTQELIRLFLENLLGQRSEGCGFMRDLDEDSAYVKPVWKKAGCNGWMITFDTVTNL